MKLEFDFESSSALHLASSKGEKELVKLLLDCEADVNKVDGRKWVALHCAAGSGHDAVVKLLLQNGADIEKDYGRGTPLTSAIESGYEAAIKLPLARSAKVNYNYAPDALDAAVTSCRERTRGGSAAAAREGGRRERGDWQWMDAAVTSCREWTRGSGAASAWEGADVNAKNRDGKTVRHLAAREGHETVVRLLFEKGPT
ncbi:hypothetical protein FGG08_006241 [Glutinoglossum americanum]|uniref:Ankyrin n=1 Tax=Glutinoglossum americanum TaxID=1670608 RepID=A0A9P8I5P5_9PEZI|nr:hypothetical protein FGG08_006241 [Glutinoglossum americanum]